MCRVAEMFLGEDFLEEPEDLSDSELVSYELVRGGA